MSRSRKRFAVPFRPLLFIIFLALIFFIPSLAWDQKLPEFYGVYVVDSEKLIELREAQEGRRTLLLGHTLGQSGAQVAGGITNLSGISVGSDAYFIFYRAVRPVRFSVGKLQFVDYVTVGTRGANVNPSRRERANFWRPVKDIRVRLAPVEGKSSMTRVVPEKQLTEGVYMFYAYVPTTTNSFEDSLATFKVTGKQVAWFYDFTVGAPHRSKAETPVPSK